jgi:ribose transport system substrate-binding protein
MKKLYALGVLTLVVAAVASTVLASTTGAARKAKPNIVWLELGANNPYWDAQHKGAAEAGRRMGFDFKAVSGNNSASDQAAILKQLVDQKVSLVMLNAVNIKAMGPSLAYAKSHGVPVLNLYGLSPAATASITFDEQRSGRVAALNALKILKQRYGKVSGTIGVLEGILGQPASDDRAKGFVDYMQKQSGVKVVARQPTDWLADKASATTQDWLVKYPDLSMIYALSDTLAVPSINVAERQNRACTLQKDWKSNSKCIVYVSVDGIFINEVQKGRLFATEVYNPFWTGFRYAVLADQIVTKKPHQRNNVIKSLLVTPQNANCVAKMTTDMEKKISTFPFEGTLQQIAKNKYHCQVLDANE